jgi:hypothetical protein
VFHKLNGRNNTKIIEKNIIMTKAPKRLRYKQEIILKEKGN